MDEVLPPDIAQGATLRGKEYGWSSSLFPDALARAESRGYACLGGQFQFRLDDGTTCEMYWLNADPSSERGSDESWAAYSRRSCAEVRRRFQDLIAATDFGKEAARWPVEIDPTRTLVFVAYFVREDEWASLSTRKPKAYHITADLAGFSGQRKFLRGLLMASLFAVLEEATSILWPSVSSGHVLGDIAGAVISSVIFAFLFVAFIKRNLNYKVVVSDECITAVHPMYERSVRKYEVKTVLESDGNLLTAPSLRISKYGRFGTWFWGGIWIPRALPEYQYVRNLALSWKSRLPA